MEMKITMHLLVALRLLQSTTSCDPCASSPTLTGFKIKPNTACMEYVQCMNGQNMGDFQCHGTTIFDESAQYCNWPESVTCVNTTCPQPAVMPTAMPTVKPSANGGGGGPSTSTDTATTITPESSDCSNPCPPNFTGFQTQPGTSCKKYVQCDNGAVAGELECFGGRIFNSIWQYCDFETSTTCAPAPCPEQSQQSPPSPINAPMTVTPVISEEEKLEDCSNPCPLEYSGLLPKPGTMCKSYIECSKGSVFSEFECFGTQFFHSGKGTCTDLLNGSEETVESLCPPTPCPEPRPTNNSPISIPIPTISPTKSTCSNPCPLEYSGLLPKPGTMCKSYVQCNKGSVFSEFECFGTQFFHSGKGTCADILNGSEETVESLCPPTPCPDPLNPPEEKPEDCSNPCPFEYSGLLPKPDTLCKSYVQCNKGRVYSEFECFGSSFFNSEKGTCADVLNGSEETVESLCPPASCPEPQATNSPIRIPNPTTSPTKYPTQSPTKEPSTPQPTFMPTSLYQNFRYYLLEREESFNTTVFVSQNGKPSTAYTFDDFVNSLDVVVYQFPPSKMFFVGQETMIDSTTTNPDVGGTSVVHSYGSIDGIQYGLINLAAFLSNAMVEGIRINSCNELNTDDIEGLNERYPLSNACGQYGRSYDEEYCPGVAESFHCKLDNKMQLNAGEVVGEVRSSEGGVEGYVGAPPFMCRPKEEEEDFTGFYDVVVKEVVNSVFANTPGRTDVEGCCWWGRGVLLTRGRCTIGRLNYYLAKQASDEGFYSRYPDINLCTAPNAICNDVESTRELRWVLGLFEWVDKVQSYNDNELKWNYMDQLKKFYDGGMRDEDFITKVTNIFTRGCHDGLCAENDILFETERKDNFKKIINEIFNLPLTRRPTPQPVSPADRIPTADRIPMAAPTKIPTSPPTRKKKAKQKEVLLAIPDSSSLCLRCYYQYFTFSFMSLMFFFI